MKEKKKLVVLIIIGIFVIGSIGTAFAFINYLNNPSKETPSSYYSEPEEYIDVLLVGGSSLYRFWDSPKAYTDYGLASYVYASQGMPMSFLKHVIHDAVKTQDPKVLIVDLRLLSQKAESRDNEKVNATIQYMPASFDRLKAIYSAYELAGKYDTRIARNPKNFRFPADRNCNMDRINYEIEFGGFFKGFYINSKTWNCKPQSDKGMTEEITEPDAFYSNKIDELMDYCDTLDSEVLFLITPCCMTAERLARLNGVEKYVRDNGGEVWNHNTAQAKKEAGIDIEKDFYDNLHVNGIGAEKYTEYLGSRLKNRYNLPDRKNDEKYSSWAEADQVLQPMIDEFHRTHDVPAAYELWKNSLREKHNLPIE